MLNYGTESTTQANRWFGMELLYDYGFVKNQYNGNIGGIRWKSNGDDEQRAYGFDYDNVNRLMKADFNQYTASTWNTTAGIDFSLSNMSYDANGNILIMNQKGLKLNTSPTIDQLTYTYNTTSNKLLKVFDAVTPITENGKLGDFKDGTSGSGNDYTYDVNGSLISDNNKAISSITYNHLNLPLVITVTGKGTITYTYDAAGSKQKKTTTETGATVAYNGTNYTAVTITTTTTYIGGAVYETKTYSNAALSSLQYTDRLQFISHEEGRIRFKYETSTFEYDYMIKDHLGNVRMVLTEEVKTDMYPAATMETATATTEETYYANLPQTRVTVPSGYPANTPAGNARVAKVTGSGVAGTYKVGPGITLKVMAGDKFNMQVNSWWSGTSPAATITNPLAEILSILSNGVASQSGGKVTTTELNSSGVLSPGALSFLTTQTTIATKPKAYVSWILFDEQFKIAKDAVGNIIASGYSGFEQVGGSTAYTPHIRINVPINKSGYLYVYVSNETPNIDVFFDNLQVTHIRGPILEETHYYPFGLTMSGISSKALAFGGPENKYKFNDGTELNSTFDLHLYETNFRSLDPQLGRFWQLDPMADAAFEYSPFVYGNNNPLTFNDPLGLFTEDPKETSTPDKPKELDAVVVTGVRKISQQYLPYLTFPNNRPYSIASDKDWPLSFSKNRANDLLDSWAMGLGAENRVYSPKHPMTKRLQNAYQIHLARAYFYKKYLTNYKNGQSLKGASVTGYKGGFGLLGLALAGTDIVEQFVGSFAVDVHVDEKGENLLFLVSNTTSSTSAFYQMAGSHDRVPGQLTARGNMNQVFIWQEPISSSGFMNITSPRPPSASPTTGIPGVPFQ